MDYEVRYSLTSGKGLFSNRFFAPRHPILKLNGKLLSGNDIISYENLLQIGTNIYLDTSDQNEFFINHSCNPNAAIKIFGEHAFLVCLLPIKPNDEITFDYSITSTDTINEWSMNCLCKQWNCRKIISGYKTLTEDQKQYYLDKGLVPKYNL